MGVTPTPEQQRRLRDVRKAIAYLGYVLVRDINEDGEIYYSVDDRRDFRPWEKGIQEFWTSSIDHDLEEAIYELEDYVNAHPAIPDELKTDPTAYQYPE